MPLLDCELFGSVLVIGRAVLDDAEGSTLGVSRRAFFLSLELTRARAGRAERVGVCAGARDDEEAGLLASQSETLEWGLLRDEEINSSAVGRLSSESLLLLLLVVSSRFARLPLKLLSRSSFELSSSMRMGL